MRRVWMAAIVLTLARTAAAVPAASYFPLGAGATWMRSGEGAARIIVRVIGSKTVGAVRCTVLETKSIQRGRGLTAQTCYEATGREIRIVEVAFGRRTVILNPPQPFLLLPPAAGTKWTWRGKHLPFDLTAQWVREETVRVPAGTFLAWRLRSTSRQGNVTTTMFIWFAPGVGIVKVTHAVRGGRPSRGGGSELISYKIP